MSGSRTRPWSILLTATLVSAGLAGTAAGVAPWGPAAPARAMDAAPDVTPPSPVTGLHTVSVTSTSVSVAWNPSTDNVGVVGYDVLVRGTRSGSTTATSFTVTGLAPGALYDFSIQARDAAGNASTPPPGLYVRTPAGDGGAAGGCRVGYTRQSEWPGGFVATLTITNTGTTTVNGWTLTFGFPGDQKVSSAWGATVAQSGATVTAVSADYDATIAPGAGVTFGIQGTWATADTAPTAFVLNGAACGA